jgi:hypothetical protein
MDPSENRTLAERLRTFVAWPLWLPAAAAFLIGLTVFLGGAITPTGGWMFSSLFLKLAIPYVVLVIIDLALAAATSRGLSVRHALIGISVATVLAAAAVILLATEIVAAIILLAALVPAWYASER